MTPNHTTTTNHGAGGSRLRTWGPVAMLAVLALVAGSRFVPDRGQSHQPRTDSRALARGDEDRFQPASVSLPATWRVTDRSDGVTTWRSPTSDDSVSVAAVEAAATPLAAIVAEVASQARAAGVDTRVAAPRQLPNEAAPRGDVVLELNLRTRVDGGHLFVRQVWRRDTRAARDVVATWTSGDDEWEVDPATTVPSLDLR